jgi:hypothetical protein
MTTAFTAPISWPTGLDVTETILNQQVRDNFKNLDERATVLEADVATAKHPAIICVVPSITQVDTASGVQYLPIPEMANGMDLINAKAFTITAGVTGATTVQVRNMTKYPANDSLTSAMSIASLANVSTGGAVDGSYDDVSTDNIIKIYVTGQSSTKPYGLFVILEFQLP